MSPCGLFDELTGCQKDAVGLRVQRTQDLGLSNSLPRRQDDDVVLCQLANERVEGGALSRR